MEHLMKTQCTKEECLMDYLEGRLSERERLRIEQHLSACDSCVEELVIAEKLGDMTFSPGSEPVPEQLTLRAVELVSELNRKSLFERISASVKPVVDKGRTVFMKPWPKINTSLAPVRGSKTVLAGDLILLRKSFSDFEAHIEIENTSEDLASIVVRLPDVDETGNPIRATLLKNDREMSSFLCVGQPAIFEGVHFGRYTLVFSRNGMKVGEYAFILKETSHGAEQEE
jgi:hypothetical protein